MTRGSDPSSSSRRRPPNPATEQRAPRLKAYAKAAEIPILTPHELRHTHGSQLLAARVAIKVVSERLGHRDVKTTLDLYQHLLPGMGEMAAAETDTLLGWQIIG